MDGVQVTYPAATASFVHRLVVSSLSISIFFVSAMALVPIARLLLNICPSKLMTKAAIMRLL